jgi:transcriptional regulator with XRE-family HTH domain
VKGVLSQRMRALRTKKGCTQKEAAVLLSMSPTAVASWEQKPKTEH